VTLVTTWRPGRLQPGPARVAFVSAAVAVPLLALRLRDPHLPGTWGTCPVLALTGTHCPGCGSLRALHDLAGGDLAAALSSNALLVTLGLPLLLVAAVLWVRGREQLTYPLWSYGSAMAVVLCFTVVRNLPLGSALAP
jgi:hypothetical protein